MHLALPINMSESSLAESSSRQISPKDSPTSSTTFTDAWTNRLWRNVDRFLISGFTPAFFALVMGTGISCNILYNFAFPARWLQIVGMVVAVVALLLFIVLTLAFAMALWKDSKLWYRIHREPNVAPYMGSFVMGYVTLVNMLHALTGSSWITGVWVLWWIEVAGLVYTSCVTFYFCTVSKHRKRKSQIDMASLSLTYLLPIVTLTVAASSGGAILPDLPHVHQQITTLVVSFIMWAVAVVLAFIVVTVNFWRFFVYKIPSTNSVLTMFLPIGFLGQGAYGILLFGRNSTKMLLDNANSVLSSNYTTFLHEVASKNNVDMANLSIILATSLLMTSTLFAGILMSCGYFFTFLAVASTLSKTHPFASKHNTSATYQSTSQHWFKRQFVGFLKFNRGFWGMTFPLGTMALANGQMYELYHGMVAFRYISAIYSVSLFGVVTGCLIGIVYRIVMEIASAFSVDKDIKEMV